VAVREFPLANGQADYLLYVDAKAIGVVEAKRADLGQLRQGQTWDSGFQPKARSIEATFLATSRFLSVARFPR
jgi:type I site-specific restriction endonuclease